jgi:non-specific serine/threonine protein kinase/serine/threonine-protein kinase
MSNSPSESTSQSSKPAVSPSEPTVLDTRVPASAAGASSAPGSSPSSAGAASGDSHLPDSSTNPFNLPSQDWGSTGPDGALPNQIGPYRILGRIGEGGIGIVYKAEQREPVKRIVALKIIKLGMDTREVVQRFAAERQALAMMDHPNVARVFDAGSTPTGRPFFVMELVAGEPITDYCDRHSLTVRQRLELFQQVCAAVQHAHQKGIIHRDLKPSNILVAVKDGKPLAKVIDFGIAKAISSRLTDATLYTEQGQLIGTPEYMSPEQAEMSAVDIDTRADIYSLGVLLYELLAGAPPVDGKTLRRNAYGEIQRIIR